MSVFISASTEPAKNNLTKYVKQIEKCADFLHCDVMDGNFVESESLNPQIIKQIHSISTIPLDVHLMVNSPSGIIENYINAGANILTLHYETYENNDDLIKDLIKIKKHKVLAGVSIKLETSPKVLFPILKFVDIVLIMSVNVGKSGQEFNESAVKKIKYLSTIKKECDFNFLIEVDGGINDQISPKLIKSGANVLVSGKFLFEAKSKSQAVKQLKGE